MSQQPDLGNYVPDPNQDVPGPRRKAASLSPRRIRLKLTSGQNEQHWWFHYLSLLPKKAINQLLSGSLQ